VVFDGAKPPLKAEVEAHRNNSRGAEADRGKEYDRKAAQCAKNSPDYRFNRARADECYQRAVRVNQKMVSATMHALRAAGVQCLVAPYEADAQLVWLALHKQIGAIITEDSDLSVFLVAVGAEAALWFKMTQHGHAWELQVSKRGAQAWADQARANAEHHDDLRLAVVQAAGSEGTPAASPSGASPAPGLDDSGFSRASSAALNSGTSSNASNGQQDNSHTTGDSGAGKTPVRHRRLLGSHWTPKATGRGADLLALLSRSSSLQYTAVAVMAGCDYLASLPGVGLITAAKLAFKFRSARGLRLVRFVAEHVGKKLRAKGSAPPTDYRKRAAQAIACFKHHLVWDTNSQRVVPLTPLEHATFQYDDAVGHVLPSLSAPLSSAGPAQSPASQWAADDDSDSIHSTQSCDGSSGAAPSTTPSAASASKSDPYKQSLEWLQHGSWAFLGSKVQGSVAHRITQGEVHPTSLATISPAKLAPTPGAARSSPGGRGRGKRATASSARDPSQQSLVGLFAGAGAKAAFSDKKAPPRFTLAVAGLVAAISGSDPQLTAQRHQAAAAPTSKPVLRALWGGAGATPSAAAKAKAGAPQIAPGSPPSTAPTLPPELAALLESGADQADDTPPAAESAGGAARVASLAGAYKGASAPPTAQKRAPNMPSSPAGRSTRPSALSPAATTVSPEQHSDVVVLDSPSPEARKESPGPKRQRTPHESRAVPGLGASASAPGAGRRPKAPRRGAVHTPAGTRSIASFFSKAAPHSK